MCVCVHVSVRAWSATYLRMYVRMYYYKYGSHRSQVENEN